MVSQDVGPQARHQEATELLASEARLRTLYEAVACGILVRDVSGAIVHANAAAQDILGVSFDQMRGRTSESLWTATREGGSVLSDLERPSRIALRTREPIQGFVMRVARPDGECRWLQVNSMPLFGEDGEPAHIVSSFLDITERKREEEERAQLLQEQAARAEAEANQQRLAFLAEASSALAASLDFEATLQRIAHLAVPYLADRCYIDLVDEDGQPRQVAVAHVDPSLEGSMREHRQRIPANPESSHPVQRVLRTGQPELCPEVPEAMLASLAGGDEHPQDFRQVGLRSAMAVPLIARERILGTISMMTAESGRIYGPHDLALAEDLARRCALALDNARLFRQLQQTLRTRDDFLASASHDLKTPLTAIMGFAQLLQREAAREGTLDTERLADSLARIDANAKRMASLINELLDVTRMQMGQPLPLERRSTDLVALAQRAICEQQTTERHRVRVEATQPELIGMWDGPRLERVLANLLSNAISYSPEGGEVAVRVALESGEVRGWALLQVQDHGLGIPAADLPHIFERFQRASNVVGRIPGAGIGLAGARQIVARHGGTIVVDSHEGRGTTVTVRLPLVPEAAHASEVAED